MAKTFDLGAVTAYAYAVAEGYTGTEKDFGEQLNLALQAGGYADQAEQYASDASGSATEAEGYKDETLALLNSIQVDGNTLVIGTTGGTTGGTT